MDPADRALLSEIGFLGCILNRTTDARQVFSALPETTREAAIGFALAEMTEGAPEMAAERLRALAEGGDPDARAMRVLALRLAGRASEAAREAAMMRPGDSAAHRLAQSCA